VKPWSAFPVLPTQIPDFLDEIRPRCDPRAIVKERLQQEFLGALERILGPDDEIPAFTLEAPRNPDHGDFACNAAMLLAKPLRQPPREIAERIVAELGVGSGLIERAEIAGPGFVNIWLSGARWHELLPKVLAAGPRFGHCEIGEQRSVQVEFVSANPTGPLTLGHGRQGVLGDCIARLLEACDYQVTREYYFNNAGRQMEMLGDSLKIRYQQALGMPAALGEDNYQGDSPSDFVMARIVTLELESMQRHGQGKGAEAGA